MLDRDEMRDLVLHVDWPQRWWLTIAGTSYTLLDTRQERHRRILAHVFARILWAMGASTAEVRTYEPPAQWRRDGCVLRPASDREVEACLRPVNA